MELLALERGGAGGGRLRGHRPRRLGRVADDRPRRRTAAAADHPPLHRRQVLRLVDEHVGEGVVLDPVGRRRPGAAGRRVLAVGGREQLLHVDAALEQPGVVERRLVVGAGRDVADARSAARRAAGCPAPRGRVGVCAHDFASSRCSSGRTHAVADAGQELGVAQPAEDRRPRPAAATRRRRSRGRTGPTSMSSSKASRPRSRPRSPRTWRHIASSSVPTTRGSWRLRRPCDIRLRRIAPSWPRSSTIVSSRQKIRNSCGLPGACCRAVRRISSAIAGRALDVGDGRLVVAGRADAVDDLAERAQRDRGLAEAGQHPLDVAHEDAAGADDQDAAGLVAAAVGVEEVRRAVQRDHGLAGAGAAGDRRRRPGRARGSPCPARPGWWRRSSASTGRGPARAGPSARPRR